MNFIYKLPEVRELVDKYPISTELIAEREKVLQEVEAIISGHSKKKLLIIGPCSADREDAVTEYVERLRVLQERVKEIFLIIPRIYTSKPRTNGIGYKGLLHRPDIKNAHDNILKGVYATRQMHYDILIKTGMFSADEMLYPETISYISDLIVYVTIGARSVENQQHRLVASGLEIPIGMKNPTGGNTDIMLNAIMAAQNEQQYIYGGWEVESVGNEYAHAILRGYIDAAGKVRPNYYYEHLLELYDKYYKMNLKNPSVIIDCNHANSNKQYDEQIRIAEEVAGYCKRNKEVRRFVKGLMIESYLEDGAQMIGGNVFGKSITDPCLGWEKTEKLLCELADTMS